LHLIRHGARRVLRNTASIALAGICLSGGVAHGGILHHDAVIEGSGARTIVFEAGAGDSLEVWKDVQPRIAEHCARTFSYTRAGYLGSDMPAVNQPRDAAHVVQELRGELQRRKLRPPYVLVGHSIGGLFMQYFARNFPGEVSGLVLIDSTYWTQQFVVDPNTGVSQENRRTVRLYMPWAMRRELDDTGESGQEVKASPKAKIAGVIVLSSTDPMEHQSNEQRQEAIAQQEQLAADFPQAHHRYVDHAGHYIQRDQPDAVVAAVREAAGCRRDQTLR
jgi:pimeloyl-ACP methyl ester carboxylesterase